MKEFDEMPPMDHIVSSKLSMEYLSHNARKALKMSGLDGKLNYYWQAQIMQLCANHPLGEVIRALYPFKSSGQRPIDFMQQGHFMLGKRFKKPKKIKCNPVTGEAIIPSQAEFNEQTIKLSFSPKAIWNLYLIDSHILVADYEANLEVLNEYLAILEPLDIEEIAGILGKAPMSWVMTSMAVRVKDMIENERQLREAPVIEMNQRTKVAKESIELLKQTLSELNNIKE